MQNRLKLNKQTEMKENHIMQHLAKVISFKFGSWSLSQMNNLKHYNRLVMVVETLLTT